MTINTLTALFLAIAGGSLGSRQILLSGASENWPCAPMAVRVSMFFAATALGGLATLFYDHVGNYAGEAAVPFAAFAGVMALYNAVLLLNMIQQRRPPHVWRRLNRAWLLTCSPPRNPAEFNLKPDRTAS